MIANAAGRTCHFLRPPPPVSPPWSRCAAWCRTTSGACAPQTARRVVHSAELLALFSRACRVCVALCAACAAICCVRCCGVLTLSRAPCAADIRPPRRSRRWVPPTPAPRRRRGAPTPSCGWGRTPAGRRCCQARAVVAEALAHATPLTVLFVPPCAAAGGATLKAWLAEAPAQRLGADVAARFGGDLPFLLKARGSAAHPPSSCVFVAPAPHAPGAAGAVRRHRAVDPGAPRQGAGGAAVRGATRRLQGAASRLDLTRLRALLTPSRRTGTTSPRWRWR